LPSHGGCNHELGVFHRALMPQLTTQQAIALAQKELQAGRIAEAQSVCRQILAREPHNVGAIQLLARMAFVTGNAEQSANLLRQAIALEPRNPQNYGNLASVLAQSGRAEEAIATFRQALSINPASIETHANLATALLGLGRADEAIEVSRQALKLNPNASGVLNNLANALAAKDDLDGAIAAMKRALDIEPNFAEGYNNLGNLLRRAARQSEALQCFLRFVELRPDLPEAHAGLAATLLELGRIDDSIRGFKATLEMKPDFARGAFGLGFAYKTAQRLDDAIEAYRLTVRLDPKYADAYLNLGLLLVDKGDVAGAIEAYNHALAINPRFTEAYNNLAVALLYQQRSIEVVEVLKKALELQPNYAGALNNLAMAYEDLGRQDEALETYRRAVEISPDLEVLSNNYGNALRESGRVVEAVNHFRSMLSRQRSALAAGNLVFAINAHPGFDAPKILEEHRKWEQQYAARLRGTPQPYPNAPEPNRRLSVGFVSGDFNQHPVGRFLQPLFVNHDMGRFEVFCYSEGRRQDVVTDVLKKHADHWRTTLGFTDEQVVRQVQADQIDILVDLAMHTKDNRLMIFAPKPAPVQVTYLAYAGTTGLSTMDYRLTDVYLDPPGQNDEFYVERSVRLPHSYWCYEALPEATAMPPSVRHSAGPITFGALNNFWKLNSSVVEVWREIFARFPESRLIIHAREGSHRQELLRGLGIDESRVRFEMRTDAARYFALYNEIDVALDPFPYPGGTTTCDALYMGVPVVTLAGPSGVSRGGVSILSNVGLPEFIANSEPEYVAIATRIAGDASRRSMLRATLRKQMQESPLMNARQFTAEVESAFKWMWRKWCDEGAAR
jgi:protein O-GlcNAc transferase